MAEGTVVVCTAVHRVDLDGSCVVCYCSLKFSLSEEALELYEHLITYLNVSESYYNPVLEQLLSISDYKPKFTTRWF